MALSTQIPEQHRATADSDNETIEVLDFGAQYTQLIARRIREIGVRALVTPCDQADALNTPKLRGIVLSGGPTSVYDLSLIHI